MKCSLIIPTHNEALVIRPTLESLVHEFAQHKDFNWEIIVVDNASTDGTKEEVESLQHGHIHVVSLPQKGKGRAVRAGFMKATGEIVGFTDADLSVEPSEIYDAFILVTHGDVDVLIGSRAHKDSALPGREWWRTVSSSVFHLFAVLIIGIRASDTQCPLKIMNASGLRVMLATKEDAWFFDLEFLALCEALGLYIKEIPIRWTEHRYPLRKSKLSTIHDGLRSLGTMFRIRRTLPAQLTVLANISKVEQS